MRIHYVIPFATILIILSSVCGGQSSAQPENATTAVLRAFDSHDLVMLGEIHGNKQEYEWLRSLVATSQFAERVDDIVMEFGNSLYQKSVDRYIAGDDVPIEQVQKAWRNTVGAIGPASPVSAWLYQAVRETNLRRRGKHQMRILCGDPYIDWEQVKDREDIAPYLGNRDQWYTQVVKDEVLAKHHRALLIMGWGHFLRGEGPSYVEPQLRAAGARTYLIVSGTNVIGGYEDLDQRFDSWPTPAIVSLAGNWVGDLAAMPVLSGGGMGPQFVMMGHEPSAGGASETRHAPLKLKDAADALLYLGPRDSLIQVLMSRTELEGTAYGKEIVRRLTIEGFPINFGAEKAEVPQFPRPQSGSGGGSPLAAPHLPPPPKNMGAPLPPRPPSQ
jgi:hypothetical protein